MFSYLISRKAYLHAFQIPPDFDDTFVNLGIGSLLAEMKDDFPASHAQWLSQNTNLTSIYDALKKYAYRPLSLNNATNTIDCRAYFYLRYFLEDAVKKNRDVALVSTWVFTFSFIADLIKWTDTLRGETPLWNFMSISSLQRRILKTKNKWMLRESIFLPFRVDTSSEVAICTQSRSHKSFYIFKMKEKFAKFIKP